MTHFPRHVWPLVPLELGDKCLRVINSSSVQRIEVSGPGKKSIKQMPAWVLYRIPGSSRFPLSYILRHPALMSSCSFSSQCFLGTRNNYLREPTLTFPVCPCSSNSTSQAAAPGNKTITYFKQMFPKSPLSVSMSAHPSISLESLARFPKMLICLGEVTVWEGQYSQAQTPGVRWDH